MPISQPGQGVDPAGQTAFAAGSDFALLHPNVWEYLSLRVYEDGKARKTATATVFVEDDQVKVCLSDRDTGRTAWSSGRTLEEALALLEGQLAGATLVWRSNAGNRRR